MKPDLGETITLKTRHLGFWGFAAALLLIAPGIAWAQQKGPYPTDGLGGGLWLIEGASTYTAGVDFMYKVIFWVVTAMFLITEGLLVYFCVVYRRRPGHRPTYTHGNRKAELTWTIVPALMLFGLAIWQIPYWNEIKQPGQFPKGDDVRTIDVFAETFAWNFRYRRSEHKYKADQDVTTKRLNLPFGDKVVCRLRSRDVIHSMFVPHMRVKQDLVPGIRQQLWFEPSRIWLIEIKSTPQKRIWVNNPRDFEAGGAYFDKRIAVDTKAPGDTAYFELNGVYNVIKVKTPQGEVEKKVNVLYQGKVLEGQAWASCDYALGIFEIACAELCGLGHYKMKSTLQVLPGAAYKHWLDSEIAEVADPEPIWKLWKD
jgi:cytochrome c oxidase subunit 2